MPRESIREARRNQDHSRELAEKGWYHSFELPDGTVIEGVNSLERQRRRFARFLLPEDLSGKRVLDIGTWDGWFSFEAERRGAAVTAIDCLEQEHFLEMRRKLASRVNYRILEIYELPDAGLGKFDIVFLLGILYHLKHPLLGLEIACALATDVVIVESFVTDGDTWEQHAGDIPTMEFYEGYELGGQFDNWVGPSVGCLLAMCRTAGFARVELLHTEPYNAIVACHRKWEPPPGEPAGDPPELCSVVNNSGLGVNFSSRKDQYISCWFRSPRLAVSKEDLRLEVDGMGIPAYFAASMERGSWTANFRLPPGLTPGWKPVRLRFANSYFGITHRIAVDMPLNVRHIVCKGARDLATWNSDEVTVTDSGSLICWVGGLPENSDWSNTRVFLGKTKLRITWMAAPDAADCTQINTTVPGGITKGAHALRIECGGITSEPTSVRVV
jgi:tRNA (mo5U34)-methyltransferase